MAEKFRVRFAPSPTGFLHIGGARTALFNWLYAKANQGSFLLRIEDTDTERSEDRFTKDIMESLKWLGMQWDEEPVYQSQRFARYQGIVHDLLAKGHAYYCECTPAQLDAVREQCVKEKRPFRYPGTCRTKKLQASNLPLRLIVPQKGDLGFEDLIRGPIKWDARELDDWIILRPNGSPTYNFSVVIDDSDQQITHVLRGEDHINNTPKQIHLYRLLGFTVPKFAHLPMILGADRSKLSKRHGAASTLEYRAMGYHPLAMINFLSRLGWSHGDQEIFTLDELFKAFSVDHIGKANAIFNPEKLNWVSGQIMMRLPPAELASYLKKFFMDKVPYASKVEGDRLEKGISIVQGKVKTILELIEQLDCLFGDDPTLNPEIKPDAAQVDILKKASRVLASNTFEKTAIETSLKDEAKALGVKFPMVAQTIRYAVTGGKVSPGLIEMLEVQGKETVIRRLDYAVQWMEKRLAQ